MSICVAVTADGQLAAHDKVRVLASGLIPVQATHPAEGPVQSVRLHARLSPGAPSVPG